MSVSSYQKLRYPSPTQAVIWQLKRNKLTGKQIAKQKQISLPSVSKTLKEANERVKALLKNAARMNKIHLNLISADLGFARGYSHVFKVRVFITYSPINGVNVWYEHEGVCEDCEDFISCRKVLIQEFKERNLSVPKDVVRPTTLGEILFQKIEEILNENS
ncbi:MAG: hypothetical protein ACFFC7_29735 [Candidatus Hermodarchaeota archaeon]